MTNSNPAPPMPPTADAQLAAIVASSFDAIISKDLNSVVTSWNPAAEQMFGYTAEEMVGQSIVLLIPESLRAEETHIIQRVRSGERVASYETIRRRKDGRSLRVSLTVSPIRDRDGGIVGASKIARDMTTTRDNERRIQMLMREVNHRVKNQFAVILSIIRETSRRATDPAEFTHQVQDRIMALSRSHDLLVTSDWSGTSLLDLAHEQLRPFGPDKQISLSGPDLTLQPNAVQHLGMAFHELATNAAKYGALADDQGVVAVKWQVSFGTSGRRELQLVWDETSPPNGSAPPDEPSRSGFGSIVLQRVAPQALSGSATFERSPGHLRWTLAAPLERCTEVAED